MSDQEFKHWFSPLISFRGSLLELDDKHAIGFLFADRMRESNYNGDYWHNL